MVGARTLLNRDATRSVMGARTPYPRQGKLDYGRVVPLTPRPRGASDVGVWSLMFATTSCPRWYGRAVSRDMAPQRYMDARVL